MAYPNKEVEIQALSVIHWTHHGVFIHHLRVKRMITVFIFLVVWFYNVIVPSHFSVFKNLYTHIFHLLTFHKISRRVMHILLEEREHMFEGILQRIKLRTRNGMKALASPSFSPSPSSVLLWRLFLCNLLVLLDFLIHYCKDEYKC